jgi:hypothetical protein
MILLGRCTQCNVVYAFNAKEMAVTYGRVHFRDLDPDRGPYCHCDDNRAIEHITLTVGSEGLAE